MKRFFTVVLVSLISVAGLEAQCVFTSSPTLAIPDSNPSGVYDTITVSQFNTDVITDLDVQVLIDHTWIGDLVVRLRHVETGTEVTLIETPGAPPTSSSCPGDDIDAILDDGAATPVETECDTPNVPAISGTFQPNGTLADFNGETLAGEWVLYVADLGFGDVGELVSWCLMPTTVPGIPYNDACADALPLECGDAVTGTTVNATMDAAPFCSTAVDAPGVWYTLVGNGDDITVSLCNPGTNYDTRINVYDGTCGLLNCIGGDDDACGFAGPSEFTWTSEPCVTYYILVQGFNGQTGDFELTVSCTSPPTDLVADAGPDQSFCYDNGANTAPIGGSPTASGGFFLFPYNYSWSPTIGLDDPTIANPTAGGPSLTPGTYVYTVTVTDTCGNVAVDSVTVTVWENPVANAGADFGICESTPSAPIGGSPTASAGTPSYNYSWSPAGGLSSTSAANPVFTHSGVGTYTFIVTVTDANGCQDMDTVTVEVWDDPEADAGNDTTVCQFEPVELGGNPTATTGTPPYSYAWTPTAELDDPTAANPTATPSVTTTYTVVVTDTNGCTAEDTVRVKVFPITAVSFTGLAAEYCENEPPSVLTGTPSGGTFTGPGITGNTFDPGLAGPGTHDIIYTYVDVNGCENADTQTTVVYDAPEADAGDDDTICNNQTLTLGGTPTVVNGTPPYTYSWTPTDYLSDPTAANPVFTPTAIPNYSYTVTVTDANGCTDSDVINITTLPAPVADAGPDVETCEDCHPVQIGGTPAAVSGNGNLDYTYAWAPSAGLNDSTVANPLANPSATTTYTLLVTDNVNGCTDTDEVTVTVNPLPAVSFSGLAGSYCVDDGLVALVGSPAGGTFYGEGVSGAPSSEAFTLCYDGTFRNIPDNTVPLNFVMNGSNIQGDELGVNVTLDSVRVVIDHEWVGDLTMTLESPGGTIVTLFDQPGVPASAFGCPGDNLSVNFVTGTGNDIENECNGYDPAIHGTFTAHSGDDLANLNDGSDPNGVWGVVITDISPGNTGRLSDVTLYFTSDGFADNATFDPTTGVDTFTVYYAYTDSNGCMNIDSQTTIVHDLPTALAGADQAICANEDATLGGSPAAVNGQAPYTYSWAPATDLDDPTAENPTFTPPAPGSYTYTLTVTDANGCTDDDEITITVHPVPVADAGADDEMCVDGSTVLGGSPTASGGTSPYTYSWAPGAGLSSATAANPTFTPGGTGTFNFTVTVTDANGCQDMDTVDIIVHPLPVVDAGNNERICANESVVLGGSPTASGTGPFTYSWSPMAGLDDPTAANPVFSASSAGVINFTVTVTDGNGCTNDDVVTITVDPVPVTDAGPDHEMCAEDAPVQLGGSPTASGGTPPYFYTWSPATGLSSTSIANPTFDPPSAGTYVITVTVRDDQGCETSDEVTVVVNPLPNVSIIGLQAEYCEDDEFDIISGTPAGGTFSPSPALVDLTFGGAQYTTGFMGVPVSIPDNDPGGVNVAQTVSVPGSMLGTDITLDSISFAIDHTWVGDLTVELFNPSGNSVMLMDQPGGAGFCGGDDLDVTIVPGTGNSMENECNNNPAISGTFTAHDGFDLGSLNDGTDPNGSWELLIKDLGPFDVGTLTSATLYFSGPSLAFDPQVVGPGTYPVIYTYTDSNGCTNADTINVVVHPLPVVDIVGLDTAYCIYDPYVQLTGTPPGGVFTGSGVLPPSPVGPSFATETFDATSIPAGWSSSNDCSSTSTNAHWKFSGVLGYNMGGTTDHTGNNGSFAWVDGSTPNCKVTLTSPSLPASSAGQLTFYMKRSNYPLLTLHNLVSIDFFDGSNWIDDIWTHQSATANEDWEQFVVPLYGYPASGNIQLRMNVDKVGQSSPFYDDVAIDDIELFSLGQPFSQFAPDLAGPGSHTVYYTYTDANGCTNVDSQVVNVYQPIADAGQDSTICNNEAMALGGSPTATGGLPPYSYSWSPATDLDDPVAANPFFTPSGAGTYEYVVTVTDDFGCVDMDTIVVSVDTVPVVSFTGLDAEYCLNAACDTLVGTPPGGIFYGPGVIFDTTGGGGGPPCVPASLTTLFNDNNQFAGNMFDITAGANDIEITGWEMNFATGGSGAVEVWYKPGTYQGFETNQAAWTQLGTTNVTAAGTGLPTAVPVGGLVIPAGQTFGIYLYGDYPNIISRYSNVPPGLTQYSNSDLTIDLGAGRGNPLFTGSVFPQRIWNGSVEYNVLPCGGSGGGGVSCVPGTPLTTTFAGNVSTSTPHGQMFDIEATNDIEITDFSVHMVSGTDDVAIYTKTGTFVGFEANPGAWTLVTTVPNVTAAGLGIPTNLNANINIPVAAGARQAFYISPTTSVGLRYSSTMGGVGTLVASDPNLEIFEGATSIYPFGSAIQGRVWNGSVHYDVCTGSGSGGGSSTAYNVPDLIYYKFDQSGSGTVINDASSPVGTNPAPLTGTLIQGGTGQFGSGLVGDGSSGSNVNTGWGTNLTANWTMSWYMDYVDQTGVHYIWEDQSASGFRCFYGGVAPTNGLIARGTIPDVEIYNTAQQPSVIHLVSDATSGDIRAYVNGVLVNTVAGAATAISGSGPLLVGGFTTSSIDGVMDEYRLYGRALDDTEIAATWNQMLPVGGGGGGVCLDNPPPVCQPTYSSGCATFGDMVNSFSTTGGLTNITNLNSGCTGTPTAAADFTHMVVTVPNGGGTFDFTVQGDPLGDPQGFGIWVDFDQDGNFSAAEQVYTSVTAANTPFNGTISVPGSVLGGEYIMRVRGVYFTPPTGACNTVTWGEAEDYTLAVECVAGGDGLAVFCPDSAGVGTHTIYYEYTDGNGCTAIDSQQVTVRDIPTVMAGADTLICFGDVATLTAQASGTPGPYTYQWFPGAGLIDSTGSTVLASPDTSTQYTVYAIDSFGCSNFDTVTVTVRPLPDVEIVAEPNDSICYGDSLCLTAEGSFGACAGGQFLDVGIQQSIYSAAQTRGIAFQAPVDFTITSLMVPNTVTPGDQCIQVMELLSPPTTFPTINTPFNTLFYTNNQPFGVPVTVSIQVSAGDWIGIIGATNPSGNTMANSYGPSGPFPSNIGGNPVNLERFLFQSSINTGPATSPNVSIVGGSIGRVEMEYCLGGGGSSGGGGSLTYLWSTGDTTGTICPNPTQSTQYWVAVTDSLGCTGYDTIDIFVNPEIVVDAGPDVDLCQGDSAVLGGSPTAMGGTPPLTYSWEPVDRLDDPSSANPTTNTLLSITYTVTVTDSNGCVAKDQVRVYSRDLPKANAGDDLTICDEDSIVIGGMPAASGGTGPYTYNWSPATGLNDPTMANPTASPAATTFYTLTVTDVYGCVDDSIMQLVVYPRPDPTINAAGPFCENDAAVFLSGIVPGGVWSGPGIIDANTGAFDPGVAGPGTHSIVYTPTNFFGCEDSDTIDIVVHGIPNVEITSPLNYCLDGSVVTLTANVSGGTWSGNGIVNASTGEFDPGVAGLGSHPVVYAYTDSVGCTGYDTVMVTVSIGPDPAIDPAGPFCSSDAAVTLTAATAGGTWSGTGITDPAAGTFDPGVAGAGSHVITYTVSAANGCVGEDSITIVVNGLANLVIDPAGPFCQEGPKVLMSASVGGGYWSGPGITNPLIGEFTPAAAGAGLHTITYTVTGVDGCISIDTEDIMVNATPDASITAVSPMCANDASITLTAATPGGTWSGPGITNAAAGTFDPATAGPGTHIITYEVTDGNGCSAESQRTIKVNELPVISGSANDVLCPGDENGKIDVSVEGGAPPYAYQWSSGQTTIDIDQIAAGNYTLTVTDSKGCSDEASFTVGTLGSPITANATITNALTPEYNNGEIDLDITSGSGPFQFNWSNGEKTEDITGLNPDTFTVVITDRYGCQESFTFIVEADFGIGIDPTDLTQNIELFPNPTQDVVNVKIELGGATEDLTLTVYDVLGRKVYERNDRISHTYNHQIDMENWASGQYMVRFRIGEEVVTKKVVLTK